jgi:hypothetical protein
VFPDLINNLKVFRFQFFEWSRHVSNALVQRKAAAKIVTVRLGCLLPSLMFFLGSLCSLASNRPDRFCLIVRALASICQKVSY